MGKRNLVVYVEDNYISIAKAKGLNLSSLFNEMLKQIIDMPENISKDNIEKEIQEKQLEIVKLKSAQIEAEKQEEKKLKEEGEIIEI